MRKCHSCGGNIETNKCGACGKEVTLFDTMRGKILTFFKVLLILVLLKILSGAINGYMEHKNQIEYRNEIVILVNAIKEASSRVSNGKIDSGVITDIENIPVTTTGAQSVKISFLSFLKNERNYIEKLKEIKPTSLENMEDYKDIRKMEEVISNLELLRQATLDYQKRFNSLSREWARISSIHLGGNPLSAEKGIILMRELVKEINDCGIISTRFYNYLIEVNDGLYIDSSDTINTNNSEIRSHYNGLRELQNECIRKVQDAETRLGEYSKNFGIGH